MAPDADDQRREEHRGEQEPGARGHARRRTDRHRDGGRLPEDRRRDHGDRDADEDRRKQGTATEAAAQAHGVGERLGQEEDQERADRRHRGPEQSAVPPSASATPDPSTATLRLGATKMPSPSRPRTTTGSHHPAVTAIL